MSTSQSSESLRQIQTLLGEDVQQANKTVPFIQRQRCFSAEQFVQMLVLGWLQHPQASLNQLTQTAQALGCPISASGLHQRLDERAVALLSGVLKQALQRLYERCALPFARLQQFRALYITDSTQIALPDALSPLFAGNGRNSSVKLQVTWDYLHGQLVDVELHPGRQPDQTCQLPVKHALAHTVQLFDLGYFKQEHLRDIDAAEAFFVCRYQHQTALFDADTDQAFDLRRWLRQRGSGERHCEVCLGQRVHLPVRLVARRVAPAQVQARRRAAKQKARKQGYTCRAATLELLAWDLLVTNLPPDWSSAEVFALYAIRFQIEWLFRLWKDQLGLDEIGSTRAERVLCHLYAHLIGAVLCQTLIAPWRWRVHEFSPLKCLQLIQDHITGFTRCLARHGYGLAAWLARLEADFRRFARATPRRKSPSTAHGLADWGLT